MFRMLYLVVSLGWSSSVFGQAPGVEIFDQSARGQRVENKALGEQLDELFEEGKVLPKETIAKLLDDPTPRAVSLSAASTKELSPTEIAGFASRKNFRVGWAYICTKCDNWHFKLGGGYPVTKDGIIVTCAHVVVLDGLPDEVERATLIAIDSEDKVHPVTAILANHTQMDAAVVVIDAETRPYAFSDQVRPGDAAYCFSAPLGQGDYFTVGIVNRFYWDRSPKGDDVNSLQNLANLKLNVSCRWAPGSSGSPVLDHFGNVIGHVARISNLGNQGDDDSAKGPMITLHIAIPARGVQALLLKQE